MPYFFCKAVLALVCEVLVYLHPDVQESRVLFAREVLPASNTFTSTSSRFRI